MEQINIVKYECNLQPFIRNFMLSVIKEIDIKSWEKGISQKNFENYDKGLGVFYTAKQGNGNIIATCGIYEIESKIAKIECLYVDKNYRGKGIATKLFNNVLEYAKNNNYSEVRLGTSLQLENAIKLYEKNGFEAYKYDTDESEVFYKKII